MRYDALKGCGTALVTPFLEDGSVDYEAYAALIDRQVAAGIDFLTVLATTAETPALSAEEKVRILDITREHAPHTPLLVGCGSNAVVPTLANMSLLADHGVDAWLVVVPFYNKPTQEGQYRYFKTIAESTDKPMVIYNVPGRTGANMTAQTCTRLAVDVPNIVAVKEASGNFEQIKDILQSAPADFCVLSGDDDMTVSIMEIGAKGVISVASNAYPGELVRMTHAALDGDFVTARALDERLHPFFKACFVESNPVPVKAAMTLMGLMSSTVRLPLSEATEQTFEAIKKTMI